MLVQNDTGGAPRTLKVLQQVALDGTTMRDLKQLWQNDKAGVPRLIFTALSVTVIPTSLNTVYQGRGASSGVMGNLTATVAGGTPPFIYAWTVTDGFQASTPANRTTAILAPSVDAHDEVDGTAIVTITDANGTVAVSDEVTLHVLNFGNTGTA